MIIAPLDLLRAAFQIHNIENAKANKHTAIDNEEANLDCIDDDKPANKKEESLYNLFSDFKPGKISSLAFYEIFFIRRYLLIYSLVL